MLGLVSGICISLAFINPYEGRVEMAEAILQLSGSRGAFALYPIVTELVSLMLRQLPVYVLMLLWGYGIYGHFCTAGIYVFSRRSDRMRWYREEVVLLLTHVCVFEAAYMAAVIGTALLRYEVTFTGGGMLLLACHMTASVLWILAWVLLVNLLAVKMGSGQAFTAGMVAQSVCVAGLALIPYLERQKAPKEVTGALIRCNPLARTILGWHSSRMLEEELAGSRYSMGLAQSFTFLLLGCLIII